MVIRVLDLINLHSIPLASRLPARLHRCPWKVVELLEHLARICFQLMFSQLMSGLQRVFLSLNTFPSLFELHVQLTYAHYGRQQTARPDSVSNWIALFNWGSCILQLLKRAGKRNNVSSTISHISSFSVASQPVPLAQPHTYGRRDSPSAVLSHAVTQGPICWGGGRGWGGRVEPQRIFGLSQSTSI